MVLFILVFVRVRTYEIHMYLKSSGYKYKHTILCDNSIIKILRINEFLNKSTESVELEEAAAGTSTNTTKLTLKCIHHIKELNIRIINNTILTKTQIQIQSYIHFKLYLYVPVSEALIVYLESVVGLRKRVHLYFFGTI